MKLLVAYHKFGCKITTFLPNEKEINQKYGC